MVVMATNLDDHVGDREKISATSEPEAIAKQEKSW